MQGLTWFNQQSHTQLLAIKNVVTFVLIKTNITHHIAESRIMIRIKRKYFYYLIAVLATFLVTQELNHFISANCSTVEKLSLSPKSQFYLHIEGHTPPKTSVVHKQFNFHIVSPGVWRSSQPNEESITKMKEYGLKTIVNLRRNESVNRWERELAAKLSINYYSFPMSASVKQDKKKLAEVLRIISEPLNQPALIHCYAGKDRTGLIAALYQLEFSNAKFDDLHKEMLMYGYSEDFFPEIIKTVRSWMYVQ